MDECAECMTIGGNYLTKEAGYRKQVAGIRLQEAGSGEQRRRQVMTFRVNFTHDFIWLTHRHSSREEI
jgi:hypothetical protein